MMMMMIVDLYSALRRAPLLYMYVNVRILYGSVFVPGVPHSFSWVHSWHPRNKFLATALLSRNNEVKYFRKAATTANYLVITRKKFPYGSKW